MSETLNPLPVPSLHQPSWVPAPPQQTLLDIRPQGSQPSPFADILASLSPSEMVTQAPDTYARMVESAPSLNERERAYVEMAQKYENGLKFGQAMEQSLNAIKNAFRDFGIPAIDAVRITQSPDGVFHVSGWGKGMAINHPQQKFIEAALNGTHPALDGLHRTLMKHIDDIEVHFMTYQNKLSELSGEALPPSKGLIQGSGLIFGNTFPEIDQARKHMENHPGDLQAFKEGLGADRDRMTSEEQMLSHYYFQAVTLPSLPAALRAFF